MTAKLFKPFRAIGFVAGTVPVSMQSRGSTYFITTAIKNSFSILHGEQMSLLLVGDHLDGNIEAIASHQDYTFCSVGNNLYIYQRQKIVDEITTLDEIHQIQVLGDLVLLMMDHSVYIYNYATKEFYNEISTGNNFLITQMVHPSAYVNKILLGSHEGGMQLWNFHSMTLIYEFKPFSSPITCLTQSPSIDVVAVGLLDGTVIIYNIRFVKEIMRVHQEGKVTAISFRTDGEAVMATSNMTGDIALWDLDEKRLIHLMTGCHEQSIHTCFFYHGLSILLTASADNSIKQWIFDSADGTPRLLKSRSGHSKPPTKITHYGDNGNSLLSVGQDQSLRYFSLIRDSQNVELSQGKLASKAKKLNVQMDTLKLDPIVQFHASNHKPLT